MKKISIFLLFILGIIGMAWWIGHVVGTDTIKSVASIQNIEQPTPSVPPVLDNPTHLSIPRLGLQASIEHVGLDEEKRMDVPKDDMNVAWYKLGVRIGERGSAVIAGHFDTKTGGPAIFYEINKLQTGDEIRVTSRDDKDLTFIVVETKTVKDATFPLEEVFARTDRIRLNLITCAGIFDRTNRNYEDRFVVYSVLKDDS